MFYKTLVFPARQPGGLAKMLNEQAALGFEYVETYAENPNRPQHLTVLFKSDGEAPKAEKAEKSETVKAIEALPAVKPAPIEEEPTDAKPSEEKSEEAPVPEAPVKKAPTRRRRRAATKGK